MCWDQLEVGKDYDFILCYSPIMRLFLHFVWQLILKSLIWKPIPQLIWETEPWVAPPTQWVPAVVLPFKNCWPRCNVSLTFQWASVIFVSTGGRKETPGTSSREITTSSETAMPVRRRDSDTSLAVPIYQAKTLVSHANPPPKDSSADQSCGSQHKHMCRSNSHNMHM